MIRTPCLYLDGARRRGNLLFFIGTQARVARESVQRLGEWVAHLCVEMDGLRAAKRNDCNSIGYSCRQYIGVHRALLACEVSFSNVTSIQTFTLPHSLSQ